VADYTVANLEEVEDSAVKFGLSPDLETHFASRGLELGNLGVSLQRLAGGYRLPFGHKHGTQEELYVVLSGAGRVKLDDEIVEIGQWDAVRVGPETMRSFEAGPEGLELLAIGAPATGLQDAENVPGWWDDGSAA
jgi:mannose-6-phosphate isomerase-like protein (cupin superfamily)